MKALAFLAAALVLVGCADAASASQTLAQYESQSVEQFAHGQWDKLYDTIHPAQQRIISRHDWSRCMDYVVQLSEVFGVDVSSQRFARIKVEPRKKSMVIPGTTLRVQATVVRTWFSIVEIGGRQIDGGDPTYVVKVNGAWRSIETDPKPADFKKKFCTRLK